MNSSTIPVQSSDSGSNFFGGLLVLYGLFALLMHFGFVPSIALWKLWPLILIWHGLLRATEPGRRLGGLFWVLIGGGVLAYYFDLLPAPLEWKLIWPVGLIALGLRIWGGGGSKSRSWSEEHKRRLYERGQESGPPPVDGEPLFVDLTMAGREDRFDGREFVGGRVQCKMAGYQLDLRGAVLREAITVIEVDCFMGGMELVVPAGVRVDVEIDPFLGGVENGATCPNPETAPRVVLRGRLVMSGIEVRN